MVPHPLHILLIFSGLLLKEFVCCFCPHESIPCSIFIISTLYGLSFFGPDRTVWLQDRGLWRACRLEILEFHRLIMLLCVRIDRKIRCLRAPRQLRQVIHTLIPPIFVLFIQRRRTVLQLQIRLIVPSQEVLLLSTI